MPNSSDLMLSTGAVYRRMGEFEKALQYFEDGARLDPLRSTMHTATAQTASLLRRYDQAEDAWERTISLVPDDAISYLLLAELQIIATGDTAAARQVLERGRRAKATPVHILQMSEFRLAWLRRDHAGALEIVNAMGRPPVDHQYLFYPRQLVAAQLYDRLGDAGLARAHYDSAVAVLDSLIAMRPDDARLYSSLGEAYAGLGRKAEAVEAAQRAVGMLPVEKEAWRGPYRVWQLALVQAAVGEDEQAIDRLEYLVSIPSDFSRHKLRLEPALDPLRDHPRFQALIADSR